MTTPLEERIMEDLAWVDALHERLQPRPSNPSPHPPKPAWLQEAQKRNPFYNQIINQEGE